MSEDPFTSVRWDRQEEAEGQIDAPDTSSLVASSPRNHEFPEPETRSPHAETSPAAQTPPFSPVSEQRNNSSVEEAAGEALGDKITEEAVDFEPQNATHSQSGVRSAPQTPEKASGQPFDGTEHKVDEPDALEAAFGLESAEKTRHEGSAGEIPQPEATLAENTNPPSSSAAEQSQAEMRQLETFSKMAEKFAQYEICLQVSDPLSDRDGNSKAFISYLVVTTTNHPDVLKLQAKEPENGYLTVKVRRRYGDFRFLHDCLIADFPQLLVPPLPAKLNFKYLTGDTFSTPFVHKRLHSLNRFIVYICQHKILSQLSVFHYFISDSAEWATFTQNLKILKDEDSESSLVGKVVNEELLTETVMNFFTSSKHKRETNKDILEISDKLKKLYENLIKLDRIFSKLNRKNGDLKTDYEAFSQQITKLAALNDEKKEENASVANVTANFRLFSESLVFFSENWARLYKHVDESFLVALKDCSKYIIRLTNLIELQHNKKIDLQVLQDYLRKAKADLAALGGNSIHSAHSAPNPALIGQYSGGLVNNTTQLIKDTLSTSATPHIGSSQSEGKKWKLQGRIQQLESEISAQTSLVNDLTSRIINEEYPNWDQFNKTQLKKAMAELCDQKISFYRGMMENWSEVELKLMKRLEELE